MSRVTAVYRPDAYPGEPDARTSADLAALFAHLRPGAADPEIDRAHAGIAIAALNPDLALRLAKLSSFIALDLPWCSRKDLRELAIQTVHLHFRCDFSFQARFAGAQAAGITAEQQAALPFWRTSPLFDTEQRLVIEYALAVCAGDVPEAVFAQMVDRYGERGTVECTTVIGWWSFWAMLINAARPTLD